MYMQGVWVKNLIHHMSLLDTLQCWGGRDGLHSRRAHAYARQLVPPVSDHSSAGKTLVGTVLLQLIRSVWPLAPGGPGRVGRSKAQKARVSISRIFGRRGCRYAIHPRKV